MRILVVGAGATGGYFGGRLAEAGQDVTFLVRPRRAAELASLGLQVRSRYGDISILQPKTVLGEEICEPFDLVLLSCKAYDLENAMASVAPAVGPETVILPLLNGMRHLEMLDERIGAARVLGGQCFIAAMMNDKHEVVHLNENHEISFGERDGSKSDRSQAIATAFAGARCNSRLSESILQEMWEKWVFIATGAGITCLMRASVGEIEAAGGAGLAIAMLDECATIAAGEGFPPRAASLQKSRATLTASGSPLTASMLRDVERQGPTEAEHVLGDLLRRGREGASPLLRTALIHLRAHEIRRAARNKS